MPSSVTLLLTLRKEREGGEGEFEVGRKEEGGRRVEEEKGKREGKNEHDLERKLLLLHDSLDSLDVDPH